MPANIPAPIMCFLLRSAGILQSPIETASNEKRTIPKGLPKINPTKIPKLLPEVNSLAQFAGISMPVFAKANKGTTKNETGLCSKCCNLNEGDDS